MKKYNHKEIEKRWQMIWEKKKLYATPKNPGAKKAYVLDMFPYPSGAGLHVGHPEGYTATDIYSRYLRMNGYDVLHPMGWDAFGLPAENYAIKEGIHPAKSTAANIKRFRKQIQSLGLSYDWSREINTAAPEYYKWTQWLFLKFYQKGLVYRKEASVNWCPKDQTVLANEQVINGRCERCGTEVVQKLLPQWFFKITDYAEELLAGLEKIDWPEPIKLMQRNWIGRSEGAEIEFPVVIPASEPESITGSRIKSGMTRMEVIKVFTTRPDTLFGATYMVLAPEYPLLSNLKAQITNAKEVEGYIEKASKKTELQRTALEKEKTGVELKGVKAINPATKEAIPIWIADYVLMNYGTGAIMAVPAHDERDWEFAKKYKLPVRKVIEPSRIVNFPEQPPGASAWGHLNHMDLEAECWTGDGAMINSGKFNGRDSTQARAEITKFVSGKLTVQYKLRDWLISRQRYWGAPIPIIHCQECGMQPVPEKDLPVKLPTDVDFRPTGQSPLTRSKSFHKVKCPKCGALARRETDTMDTFVDSSWYWLRYTDPQNKKEFAASKEIQKWCPVDLYVGGAEHAVLHLMYARFFCKALRDMGFLKFGEPFLKLRNQGLILGPDGQKMSKSRGNVINPDDVVEEFGADSMRMYEMFMGPLEDAKPWSTQGINGVNRFLHNIADYFEMRKKNPILQKSKENDDKIILPLLHKTIKKVTEDIKNFKFNTAVSQMMIFLKKIRTENFEVGRSETGLIHVGFKPISQDTLEKFLLILAPFAPHLTEELWVNLGHKKSIHSEKWPEYDPGLVKDKLVSIAVQINGRTRAIIQLPPAASEREANKLASEDERVSKYLSGQNIRKVVYVPGKIINFLVN